MAGDSAIAGMIIDIDDPGGGGIRLVEELTAESRRARTAVVVVTRQTGRTFVQAMIQRGIAGYLLKPLTSASGLARLAHTLVRLAEHHKERRHIRVRPDPDELARVSFRLPGAKMLLSGKVLDISLGGMAAELLGPSAADRLAPGMRIPSMRIALSPREIVASGIVVSARGRTVAVRWDNLPAPERGALGRYIYKRMAA
jgi:hypothetical protein